MLYEKSIFLSFEKHCLAQYMNMNMWCVLQEAFKGIQRMFKSNKIIHLKNTSKTTLKICPRSYKKITGVKRNKFFTRVFEIIYFSFHTNQWYNLQKMCWQNSWQVYLVFWVNSAHWHHVHSTDIVQHCKLQLLSIVSIFSCLLSL